ARSGDRTTRRPAPKKAAQRAAPLLMIGPARKAGRNRADRSTCRHISVADNDGPKLAVDVNGGGTPVST
ncbi:hypothetical protein, partial [Rhizobium sp. BIGb0125]|uniref:hypothetical protein n=1 Tax=Rhizobium sp. BIGb0125 TaxID=2940618 RepID=UPI0021697EB7